MQQPFDFRATHAYLRGYSDAVGGFTNASAESWAPAAYERGWAAGLRNLPTKAARS